MRRITTAVLSGAAVLALAVPAASQARHGADDPAGHERHGTSTTHQRHDGRDDRRRAEDRAHRRGERHHRRHRHEAGDDHGRHHRAGDDHGRRHGGHGADD